MTINISPDPKLAFLGNDGKPLVGGKLYTYAAGTTTPLATYTDYTGATPNTNPVVLDSRGEASVWLGTSRYKFVLKDANNVEIWTQDNLIMSPGADGSGAYGNWNINITGNAATATNVDGGYVQSVTAGSNITITGTAKNPIINAPTPSTGTVTSVNGAGAYGFSVTGGPITSSGTLTFTPPAPGASGNVMTSNGTNWVSSASPAPVGTFGAIGSYVQGVTTASGGSPPGTILAGSSIGCHYLNSPSAVNPPGTYIFMGAGDYSIGYNLFQRIY